jgi:hypothetical protein
MNKKPVIISDVDSVLLDWFAGFVDFLKSKDICTKHVNQNRGTTIFVPTENITNINCEKTNKLLVKEFSKSNFLKNLKIFQEDSQQHIQELSKEFDFIGLSCISKNKIIKRERTLNLQNIYGDIFLDVICIGYGQSKEQHLKDLNKIHNVYGFVDDRMKHIEESILANVNPILFSRGVDTIICPNDSFRNMHCWGDIKDSMLLELELNNKKQETKGIIITNSHTKFKNK